MGVQKSGRSTAFTRGRVTIVGTTINVGFGMGRSARFNNQIVTSPMGEPGDSGSLLLDGANRAVALLFAGSSKATLYHPITDVLNALDIYLTEEEEIPELDRSEEYRSMQKQCVAAAQKLFKLPNVVGVGLGHKVTDGVDTKEVCISVLVARKLPPTALRDEEKIPNRVNELRTDVVESGEIVAKTFGSWYGNRLDRRTQLRPARPGLSIAHYRVSAGTFGAMVYDRKTNEPLILSNNHVLANATNGYDNLSSPGDPILQPGPSDGGLNPKDIIATLLRTAPLHFL
jgi:hypothetical protein